MSGTRSDALPLHRRIQEWLRGQIDSGAWKAGDPVPTEEDLAARFGVSRAPVRQALAGLVFEGLVQRYPGRGTFVARPKIGQALDTLRGLAEELRVQGLDPEVRVLRVGRLRPPRDVREALRLPSGATVLHIDRLVRVADLPLLWDRSFLAVEPDLPADRRRLGEQPLFALVESCGFVVEEAEQSIEAAAAGRGAAAHLAVRAGTPVLLVRRLTLVRRARPMIFTLAVYRGDRYRYRVGLKRRPGPPL